MQSNVWHECLRFAAYYAPRGRQRLLMLGESIGQRYLSANDQLIGILGEAGTGKSSIINGMFPGLELTNDDAGINVRPLPLMRMAQDGKFTAQTFHLDVRFEMAFSQLGEIAQAIRQAIQHGRRVIVEHFDAIYPVLEINAQFLVGVGEEIVLARPNIFGPFPEDICKVIDGTAIYRKMAHSAEDITSMVLERDFGIPPPPYHSDVPRGFVVAFDRKPKKLNIPELELKVLKIIADKLDISYADAEHIRIGKHLYGCTGPRIHVRNSGEIRNFRLLPELVHDIMARKHCLVGLIGEPKATYFVDRHPDLLHWQPQPPAKAPAQH